jgi:hypothetical protein
VRALFGELASDPPPHLQFQEDGKHSLRIADNVFPVRGGKKPIKAFSAITDELDHPFLGGTTFKASDNTVSLLAGTATDLYLFDSSLAWTSILGSLTAGRWFFTQFNDHAIATHGGAPVDIDLQAGTAAALAGSPPDSDYCATTNDFAILAQGNIVTWSGFQDRAQWTAGVNQSGSQPLLEGGPITGLAGGEVCLIFQRNYVRRMAPNFSDTIWQFDVISNNVGCIAAGSIVQVGRLVFFLSDRGWHVTDGNDVRPLGEERVDRTFLADFSPLDIESTMYSCIDPKSQIITWTMPARQFHHHISLNEWTTGSLPVKACFNGYTAGVNLEQLDAIYGDLDSMGDISLDDPRFAGGDPQYLFVNTSDAVGVLSGDNVEATIELPYLEFIPGQITRMNRARPISDATDGVSMRFNARMRLGDTGETDTVGDMEANGDIPCRVSGRFIKAKVTIAAGTAWSYLQGVDFDALAQGGRR